MKKEIPDWMKQAHEEWRTKWMESGTDKNFYDWLCDNVMKEHREGKAA